MRQVGITDHMRITARDSPEMRRAARSNDVAKVNFSAVPVSSFHGSLLRKVLQLVPKSAVVPVLQGPLKGARWIVGSSQHGCWLGTYEAYKQLTFKKVISASSVVYDIGANVGFYSLLASRLVGPHGLVYAFEPLPGNVEVLRAHLKLNKVKNVEVLNLAVSSSNGEANFAPGEYNSLGCLAAEGSIRVRTVTLDEIVSSGTARPPNVLKIDVEGAELEVLRGSRNVLAQHKPTIFLATHNGQVHNCCCELLTTYGYSLASLTKKSISETEELVAEC